jgi:hypothetical protein
VKIKDEWIKYLAIGLAGVYIIKKGREKGKSLLAGDGVSFGGRTFKINPENLVDAVMPLSGLPDREREYASLGLKEFFRGLKK